MKLSPLLKPLTVCGTLFGIVRFGWWLLIERLHLDGHGGLVVGLGISVYLLALIVIILLPLAWQQLSKTEQDS